MGNKITILFGEMGAGKNYWGEIIAQTNIDTTFFDGDTVATPEMIARVSKFKPLNREIIQRYVQVLYNEIVERASKGNLVVSQALYKDEDRQLLLDLLCAKGFRVKFYWIKTSFWRNLRQIWSRPNGFRWVLYWLMNKPFFEKPTHDYNLIW